jgi:hypothetical protein
VVGSCENGNETSGFIKCLEFIYRMSDNQLLKNDSAGKGSCNFRLSIQLSQLNQQ